MENNPDFADLTQPTRRFNIVKITNGENDPARSTPSLNIPLLLTFVKGKSNGFYDPEVHTCRREMSTIYYAWELFNPFAQLIYATLSRPLR
jgi:hypothetical protein